MLPLGSYYAIEVKTNSTHVLDTKKYEFTIEAKDNETPIIYESFSILNYLKKGTLDFTKTDLVTGVGIPNTKIKIYTEDGKLIFIGLTDQYGKIIIKNLFVGKFYIMEEEASTGYVLTDEKVYFEIKDNGEIVKASMNNEKIKSKIKIHKVDEKGNPLAGVKIGVFDIDGSLINYYITNKDGFIELELNFGKYYYQELESIEGYELNDEKVYFEVTTNGAIIEKTLINQTIPDVPYTGVAEKYYFEVLGLIFILSALGVIIYDKKRK